MKTDEAPREAVHVKPAGDVLRRVEMIPAPVDPPTGQETQYIPFTERKAHGEAGPRILEVREPAHVRGMSYRAEVLARVVYLEWEPGNGSCYRLVLTDLSGLSQQVKSQIGAAREAVLVTWENPPTCGPLCAVLNRGIAWRHLWGLWPPQGQVDVLEVARAIEAALGWDLMTSEAGTLEEEAG